MKELKITHSQIAAHEPPRYIPSAGNLTHLKLKYG